MFNEFAHPREGRQAMHLGDAAKARDHRPPAIDVLEGFSVEVTTKNAGALAAAAPLLPPGAPVAITFLPGDTLEARLAAVRQIRALGFDPIPHISARRIDSMQALEQMVEQLAQAAAVDGMFIVAGDPDRPAGPFADSMSIIQTGVLERHGIVRVGIAGHPQGHPAMTVEQTWRALDEKYAEARMRGLKPVIVTQFGFDADPFLHWLEALRSRGIDALVRVGVPGPAGAGALLRFAAQCGVSASAAVMAKYGASLTRLFAQTGPDRLIDDFRHGLGPQHGQVRFHFYAFGGLARTVEWVAAYRACGLARISGGDRP